ncbi:50S ribosomal protein L35 [Patescibacteria group bacterium]
MSKQKQKIKKSVKRRFKVTKSGKILHRGSHVRHLRRKKKKSQIRAQKIPKELKGAWRRKIKKLLGE